MNEHTCHARHCDTPVPRRMFMCRRHWSMLPKAMRDAVWAEYVSGQENHLDRVTREYLNVTRRCINFVAAKEYGLVAG